MEISGLGFRQEILASGQLPDAQEVSGRILQKIDQDGDGFLNAAELGDRIDRLAGADQDEDGLISQSELVQQIEAKMAEFGGPMLGERPGIQQLKSMMGAIQQKISLERGSLDQGENLFSMLDSLEGSEEEKDRLKQIVENNPFNVLA